MNKKEPKSENKMVKQYDCPACGNKGLKLDIESGFRVVTTGRPMKEFPSIILCVVCKRKIKYDVVKNKE
jgi:hypothetical protein